MFRLNLTILLLFLLLPLEASDPIRISSLNKYQRIDVSYIFGGQVYNNNYIHNPGYSFQATYGIMINEMVGFGCGIGHQSFKNERFIPLYFEAVGYKRNNDITPMLFMQAGYSYGWYSGQVTMNNFDFRGGVYFQAGIGRKISIGNNYSVLFHGSYRHQFANMTYQSYPDQEYSMELNYDMLVISLGLIRHKQ